MKKIVINGRFLLHRVTGVERYAREILFELDALVKPGEIEMAVPPETEDIPEYKNIRVVRVGKLHNRLWEHVSFPAYAKKSRRIPLNLCNVAPLPDPGIVCIHDMKIKARPQDFSRSFLLWYRLLFYNAFKRARCIITVSKFSKREICRYYKVNPKRVAVIPNGWQHYERTGYDEHALDHYGLQKGGYYFSLCSLEPNKNFRWVAEVAKRNPDQIFAVAGSVNDTVFAGGLGFERPANMKLLGYVSDEEAKTLMRDCRAFLFPTFYEGFGIPPMEAMSAGARSIVVSDIPVMHEIFGDSVSYIDPGSYSEWDGSELKDAGSRRSRVLSKYSWKEVSAPRLYELLQKV